MTTTDELTRPGIPIRPSQPLQAKPIIFPTKRLTAQDAINAVVAAEGDLDLAAERLFGYGSTSATGPFAPGEAPDSSEVVQYNNKTRLIALLAEDASAQQDLQRILRTLSMLKAFSTFNLVATTVDGTLEHMDGNSRARFMTKLLDSLALLTDDHTQTVNSNQTRLNLNMTEAVMKSLPPDVQQAVKMLTVSTADDGDTIEGEWSIGDPPPNVAVGTPDTY